MNKKSGITMLTIVIYVVIFFALTAIFTGVMMAINSNSLKDKGNIYIGEAETKLRSNIAYSIDNSSTIEDIADKIVFSNNDVYYYNSDEKTIYKNNGILVQNVKSMEFTIDEIIQNHVYKLNIIATLEKYGQSKEINISYIKSEV